jgi:hypothetical protein
MATPGASLLAILGANADPLIQELRKSERDLKQWGKSVEGSLRNLSGVASGLGNLIGVGLGGSLSMMVKNAVETVGALKDQAEAVKLNTDEFQGYMFMAGQAGLSNEQFLTGMGFLSRTFSDAKSGVEAASKTFQKWGIDISNARDSGDVMIKLLERFKELGPELQNSFSADFVGGKLGTAFTNFFADSDNAVARAREFGAVIDADIVLKAKAASDQLNAMGTVISANVNSAIVEMLPNAREMAQIFAFIGNTSKGIKEAFANLGVLPGTVSPLVEALKLSKEIKQLQSSTPAALDNKLSSGGGFQPAPTGEEKHAFEDYLRGIKEENQLLQVQGQARSELKALFAAEAAAKRDGRKLTDEQTQSVLQLTDANFQLTQAQEEIKKNQQEMKQFADQMASSMTSAFSDAVTGGKDLRTVFSGLLQDIANMIIRFTVLKPLAESLSSAFSSGGSSSSSSGGGFLGGIFSSILGFAEGGFPPVGKPFLVGEKGPELMMSRSPMQVVPNRQLRGMSGGGMVVNIHAPGADRQGLNELRAAVISLHGMINESAGPDVVENRVRTAMGRDLSFA